MTLQPSSPSFRSRSLPTALGAGALCLVLGALTAAHAMPTGAPLAGITGTGTMPTTQTVPSGQVELGLAYEDVDPVLGDDVRFSPIGTATLGFKRGEVGGAVLRERLGAPLLNGETSNTYTALHAKYRYSENPSRRTSAAVGVHYLTFGDVPGHVTTFYFVASKELLGARSRYPLTASVGVLAQTIKGANPNNATRPFVGGELGLSRTLSLAADYTPEASQADQIWSVAARYQGRRLGAQVGYGQFRGSDDKLFVGATLRFGGAR